MTAQPMGRCPQCGAWNTQVEEIIQAETAAPARLPGGLSSQSKPRRLAEINQETETRWHLPIGEFSRVLGGGIVPGSIVLVGGDPGIGKSTLLLQMAIAMSHTARVLYVSGEESEKQIHMRATRLLDEKSVRAEALKDLYLVTETSLQAIFDHASQVKPARQRNSTAASQGAAASRALVFFRGGWAGLRRTATGEVRSGDMTGALGRAVTVT